MVAVVEFDGRMTYRRKDHCLALLLVPHFCLSHACVQRYVHSPGVKMVEIRVFWGVGVVTQVDVIRWHHNQNRVL